MEQKRVLLTVAYDGTCYSGWQVQPGKRTIEGELNRALSALLSEDIAVIGASRTDAGVHALCNKAVFDTRSRIPAEKFSYALNTRLPEDICIVSSSEVPADFHPRRIKCSKTYTYTIYNAPFPDPVRRLYSHFTYVPLDAVKMNEAGQYLVGTHDFSAFCTYKPEVVSTERTITRLEVRGEAAGDRASVITISVTGNGFLYHMVRIIAGTLMEVGRGAMQPENIQKILASRDREKAGPTAPARGLLLAEYSFDEAAADDE